MTQRKKKSPERRFWIGATRELAHQMGTPLSALMGWLDVLPSLKDPRAAYLEMNHNLDRLKLIGERLGQMAEPTRFDAVNLKELLSEVQVHFQKKISKQAGIQITVTAPDDLIVRAHRPLLSWALECLMKNALDAGAASGGTITLRAYQRGQATRIEIEDNGRGIDPELKDRLFEPGFSTKLGGQGMGLALAHYAICEGHGGRLELADRLPEAGTIARIILKSEKKPG